MIAHTVHPGLASRWVGSISLAVDCSSTCYDNVTRTVRVHEAHTVETPIIPIEIGATSCNQREIYQSPACIYKAARQSVGSYPSKAVA